MSDLMGGLPDFLETPMAVAGYRARIAVQRPHQVLNFDSISVARQQYEEASALINAWPADKFYTLGSDEEAKQLIWKMEASRALFEDLASILLLLAASTIERFHREVGVELYGRGAESYVAGITFVRAVVALSNQYKHLGQWTHRPRPRELDRDLVEALVDQPFRTDAAAEFLRRSGFTTYDEFESALLTCSDGIADPSIIADGRGGMRTITVRAPADDASKS
jgi:hypothetical protein